MQNSAFSHELYSPDDILGASGSDGILAHGGFATVRLGYENTIGVVAIKSIRLSGSRRTIERNRETIQKFTVYTECPKKNAHVKNGDMLE